MSQIYKNHKGIINNNNKINLMKKNYKINN